MTSRDRMRLLIAFTLAFVLSAGCVGPSHTPLPSAAAVSEEKPELEPYFQGFTGAFVLYDLNQDRYIRYNPERCSERFLPASTFKIVNSLIALETGAIRDENHVISWDGTLYDNPAWNQNHTLKTAFQNSVVWYYQELARRVGRQKMQQHVDAIGYGNRNLGSRIDSFWLDGALTISADEQVELLKKLYQDQLPFSKRGMDAVKEILVVDHTATYQLSGKTGSGQQGSTHIGWFVGYLEEKDNVHFFATRIEGSSPEARGAKAREITQAILQSVGLFPGDRVQATPTLSIELPHTYTYNDPDGNVHSIVEPPPAILEINGAKQVSAVGTFCWHGICNDPFAALTPLDPLVVTAPLSATLTLLIEEDPSTVELTALRVTAEHKMNYTGGAREWWDINYYSGQSKRLRLQKEQSFELELDRGLYVVSVLVFWDNKAGQSAGDVAYGFLIEVK